MKRKSTQRDDSITTHEEQAQDAVKPSSDKKKRTKLNRRQFLVAGTGAAAAVITTGKTLAGPQHDEHSQGNARQAIPVGLQIFPQPPVLISSGGAIDVPLVVSMIRGTQQIRAYNGNVPGPTIRLKDWHAVGCKA